MKEIAAVITVNWAKKKISNITWFEEENACDVAYELKDAIDDDFPGCRHVVVGNDEARIVLGKNRKKRLLNITKS